VVEQSEFGDVNAHRVGARFMLQLSHHHRVRVGLSQDADFLYRRTASFSISSCFATMSGHIRDRW
jgi:hypothetical protein